MCIRDRKWRKKVLDLVSAKNPENILDIATGTGDLAILMTKTKAKKIIGLDISAGMLEVGKKKIAEKKLEHIIDTVSYTHRDVYKRQMYEYARRRIKQKKGLYFHFVLFFLGGLFIFALNKWMKVGAVSYTHLDVYKRQNAF